MKDSKTLKKESDEMKLTRLFTMMLAMLFIASFSVNAGETTKEAPKDAPKELKNQTNCPVMGGKIDSAIYTDIQGQRVYHCCPMCSKKLKADPDKFFKKAAADGILFENIQETCPVSGEKLEDKSVYTDYEGRRIYFCCKKCRGTFNDDPQKFLSKMDMPAKEEKEGMKMKGKMDMEHHGQEGHDH